jgi:endonuclease G
MKKLLLTLSLLSFSFFVFSQDTVRLVHKNYTSVYSKSKSYPVLVQWWVTKSQVSCPNPVKRNDKFLPDPLLPKETDLAIYYKGSGFDRGHMSPAADNLCDGVLIMGESFYFSNMSPQYHSLNAGDWKSLETHTRDIALKYDSIRVWCGNLGEVKKIGKLSVPEKCWKVLYIKSQKKYHYYIFNNDQSKPDGMVNNEITQTEFKKFVKIKLGL